MFVEPPRHLTHQAKPLIVISLIMPAIKAARKVIGWDKTLAELLIIDASNKWKRTSLDLSYPHVSSLSERRRKRSVEAYFAVSGAGDINGDGRKEIVCGISLETNDSCLISYSRDKCGWRPKLIKRFDSSLPFIRSLSVGDVNRDGIDEIVVGGRPHGHVVLLEPEKNKKSVIESFTYGRGRTNTREVLIADATNDGKQDIVVTVARQDAENWARTPGVVLLFKRRKRGWERVVVTNFDHMTHARMLRVDRIKGRGSWIVVNAVGVFDEKRHLISHPSSMKIYRITKRGIEEETVGILKDAIKSRGFACGDVDGDGHREIIVGTRGLDLPGYKRTFMTVYKYDSKKRGWNEEVIDQSDTSLGFHCVGAFDLDGDGQDEIIASEDAKGHIKMYKKIHGKWTKKIIVRYPRRLFVTNIFGMSKE